MAGTRELSWRRLRGHIKQSAADPGSALYRALAGEWAPWGTVTNLAVMTARMTHALEVANWQRGADEAEGKSRKHYPEPILLPGQERPQPRTSGVERTFTGRRMSIEEANKLLGW